ncbi:Hint domain-containing protein [Pararhodobacter oceanensis]|uniref:Hint domain-containing protein n=1 Tax=Pararhodobacter oceanensis TaxID=2172121 RepID=UPI003A911BB4
MSSVSGFNGVYAVDWAQTAPGEEWGLDPAFLTIGMIWQWRGRARRLDAPVETLLLDRPVDRIDARARVRARMERLALAEMPQRAAALPDDEMPPGDGFTLTDGIREYSARIVRSGARLLAVFDPLLPPPDCKLWISALQIAPQEAQRRMGVICFLPGTQIATPQGLRLVEELQPGEPVETRDNGAQRVVWRGETKLTGAELYLYPHLRPLRIRAGALGNERPEADLLVSPSHRMLMPLAQGARGDLPHGGAAADEVLIAAEDLEDGRLVRRDFTLETVRYVHLMFERHEIISANGQPCESFHPGLADPRVIAWHARSLAQVDPALASHPERFGATARRCLSRGEAAILRAQPANAPTRARSRAPD